MPSSGSTQATCYSTSTATPPISSNLKHAAAPPATYTSTTIHHQTAFTHLHTLMVQYSPSVRPFAPSWLPPRKQKPVQFSSTASRPSPSALTLLRWATHNCPPQSRPTSRPPMTSPMTTYARSAPSIFTYVSIGCAAASIRNNSTCTCRKELKTLPITSPSTSLPNTTDG